MDLGKSRQDQVTGRSGTLRGERGPVGVATSAKDTEQQQHQVEETLAQLGGSSLLFASGAARETRQSSETDGAEQGLGQPRLTAVTTPVSRAREGAGTTTGGAVAGEFCAAMASHTPPTGAGEPGGDTAVESPALRRLLERIENRTCVVGVMGLGYVGLPLANTYAPHQPSELQQPSLQTKPVSQARKTRSRFHAAGFRTLGFDTEEDVVASLTAGRLCPLSLQTLNPKPQMLNPKPQTPNPKTMHHAR